MSPRSKLEPARYPARAWTTAACLLTLGFLASPAGCGSSDSGGSPRGDAAVDGTGLLGDDGSGYTNDDSASGGGSSGGRTFCTMTQGCPQGCCNSDGTCQPGTVDDACGTGGAACVNCNNLGQTCAGGACSGSSSGAGTSSGGSTSSSSSSSSGGHPDAGGGHDAGADAHVDGGSDAGADAHADAASDASADAAQDAAAADAHPPDAAADAGPADSGAAG